MQLTIQIPEEFEQDFISDKFEDFFKRVLADMNCVCGNYEKETAEMFIKAFKEAKLESRGGKSNESHFS